MKNLSVVIIGGGSGLGALLGQMAVQAGAAALGIIDLNALGRRNCADPRASGRAARRIMRLRHP